MPVAIGKGENSGNTITYHNVVRRWVKLGEWTGAARTFKVPVSDVTGAGGDAVAVVVQAGSKEAPGTMLGADDRGAALSGSRRSGKAKAKKIGPA